ncbi:aldehyde dehydrogenase family protein [Schlesneria paludicola]|uniref:aldehyde dehydrogenase family protein n=1 Tax=Schlesneria paludicola TaxID=360056 RepID=UPI00029A1A9C|nr:aldehyde dehydrogenase family protein [Schlesneria paludicola]
MIVSDSVAAAVSELQSRSRSIQRVSIDDRVRLCRESLSGMVDIVDEWIQTGARLKQCPGDTSVLAEELLSGPAVIARQLRLTMQTLEAIKSAPAPRLPGSIQRLKNGQLAVPVFPAAGLFDSLTFSGLTARVRMQPGIDVETIHGNRVNTARDGVLSGITAVLGAGNVSSIPVTDCLNRIMFEGRQVVLKMNPVNQSLASVIERAFSPLVRAGLLRIVTGGAAVGAQLIHDAAIDDVHLTGSVATHDSIVWGRTHDEQQQRKHANDPLFTKPVTSELGNVSPWIIVPGRYSSRELHSQARHLVASITNNASFNCLTTRVIVTWKQWEQRSQFLELLNVYLSETPRRPAWYPGAAERYERFAANAIQPDKDNCLPWTLLPDQSAHERPELFQVESFTCVCAETSLGGASPSDFLATATDFLNDVVFGSLCASVTFPRAFRHEHSADVERCLLRLRYGTVCVNQWSGLAYGLVSPPWGAYPGATLNNVDSGIGNVHNMYLLDQYEKTVLEGPLINFPKPVWFAGHKTALSVAKHLFGLYDHTSIARLPSLFAAALMG